MDKGKRGSMFPISIMPMMALLANLTIKPKKEEESGEPIRKRLHLEHRSSSVRINPIILMDRRGQVNCIGEPVFNQLGLPRSSLNKGGEPVVTPKGTILESLGTIKLVVPCRCGKPGCHAQEIQFNVIKGLMEQGIISNSDGWRLGWI